ncbi:MAG: ribonuclease HII [Candidatus Eremiobacteraeota bacterium]|nr:ribonuclease HII [Candidatus Eremiobacteraeota bacterium]
MCKWEASVWPGLPAAGADEVGRGPMAGPLVAAAVAFGERPWIPWLKDSKKLKPEEREELCEWVKSRALAYGVGIVTVEEINDGNLHHLSLEAMRRALSQLPLTLGLVLIDGKFTIPNWPTAQQALVKGDDKSVCIAAASILAKVTRDRMMVELEERYPGYGLAEHKGYATDSHMQALRRLGPSPIHRFSFAPVREASQGLLF